MVALDEAQEHFIAAWKAAARARAVALHERTEAAGKAEIDAIMALGAARSRVSPAALFAKGARGTLLAVVRAWKR